MMGKKARIRKVMLSTQHLCVRRFKYGIGQKVAKITVANVTISTSTVALPGLVFYSRETGMVAGHARKEEDRLGDLQLSTEMIK